MLPETSQDKTSIMLWSNSAGTPASWGVKKLDPDHSCSTIRGTELDERHHKYRSVRPPPPPNGLVELRYFLSFSALTWWLPSKMMSQFPKLSERCDFFSDSMRLYYCIMSLDSSWVALIYFLSLSSSISQQIREIYLLFNLFHTNSFRGLYKVDLKW